MAVSGPVPGPITFGYLFGLLLYSLMHPTAVYCVPNVALHGRDAVTDKRM